MPTYFFIFLFFEGGGGGRGVGREVKEVYDALRVFVLDLKFPLF